MRKMTTFFVLLSFLSLTSAFAGGNKDQPGMGLSGNALPHPISAPDFVLTDQHGVPFRMADTRGNVVLLSFIYTHCTDICPFIFIAFPLATQRQACPLASASRCQVGLLA